MTTMSTKCKAGRYMEDHGRSWKYLKYLKVAVLGHLCFQGGLFLGFFRQAVGLVL